MASGKPLGTQEYGYILRAEGDEHEVWETTSGRFSIYHLSPTGYRNVKSNMRSLEDAIELMEQIEGRVEIIEPEYSPHQGRRRSDIPVPVKSPEEIGISRTLSPEVDEWLRREIHEGRVVKEPPSKRLGGIGSVHYKGHTLLYETDTSRVWKSPAGRYSVEEKIPGQQVLKRSGIGQEELHRMLSERDEELPYQMPMDFEE